MKHITSLVMTIMFVTFGHGLTLAQSTQTPQLSDSTKVATIKVKGITCDMDLKMIAANVEALDGVDTFENVKKGATATFEVTYNAALVKEKEIYAAIEGTGSCEDPNERPYKVKK